GEAALRGEPRMQPLPVSPALPNHRTGPPPASPSKRKLSMDQGDEELDCENDHVSKMSRMFSPHLNSTADLGRVQQRSRSPAQRNLQPSLKKDGSSSGSRMGATGMANVWERDLIVPWRKKVLNGGMAGAGNVTVFFFLPPQNRPSVITCASANNRNCNLSHCPIAHSGCAAGPAYRRPSSTAPACDPVVEEHFRRSLGKNYKEPEPVANSVSITGSVDDHFAKALGDTWLQIKAAKDGVSSSPESASRRGQASPSSHMVNHTHSPSVVS
ncbi:VGLL4 protein, partial [Columbina picui]|nr:VGLL4 protein [Columbina picui]